jgi:phosphatidylinositol 3-kinase
MVDAMGGPTSPHYTRFKSLCYTAFIGLRKNANLILNLVALMVDANIQDIRLEPDKAVLKVGPPHPREQQPRHELTRCYRFKTSLC